MRRLRIADVAANVAHRLVDVTVDHDQVEARRRDRGPANTQPKPSVLRDGAPTPARSATSSIHPAAWTTRYRPIISLSKFVMARPGVPELSKSPTSTPIPARAFPSVLNARPASTATSLNVPLRRLR